MDLKDVNQLVERYRALEAEKAEIITAVTTIAKELGVSLGVGKTSSTAKRIGVRTWTKEQRAAVSARMSAFHAEKKAAAEKLAKKTLRASKGKTNANKETAAVRSEG